VCVCISCWFGRYRSLTDRFGPTPLPTGFGLQLFPPFLSLKGSQYSFFFGVLEPVTRIFPSFRVSQSSIIYLKDSQSPKNPKFFPVSAYKMLDRRISLFFAGSTNPKFSPTGQKVDFLDALHVLMFSIG